MNYIRKEQCKFALLNCFFIFLALSTFAQQNNPLINSGDLIEQGNSLYDNGKYKDAIALYDKISRSDTNYSSALYETSYACYADSQLTKAYDCAQKGIELYPEQSSKFTMLAGNALDMMKKRDEAVAVYDKALLKDPQSSLLYFNKAITLINAERNDEAIKALQQCLMINPYQNSAHYYLGVLYLKAGKLIPAMLCFKTYLLLAPEGKYNSTSAGLLASIAKVTDDVLGYVKNKKSNSKEDNFDMLQEILLSKVALDRQYKLKADLEDVIVRQLQVVDEKLEYNKNDKGFCMQYYVPIYQKLFAENSFEPMIFYLFSGLKIKEVDNWNKKNKKKLEDMAGKAGNYFNEIRSSRILDVDGRKDPAVNYLYSDGKLLGDGPYRKDKDGKVHLLGTWEFFYSNGGVKAKGKFNEEEKKEGEWTYYYENGIKKEKGNYVNGELEGTDLGWFDNGNKWYIESYSAGKLNGAQTTYYYNENLKTVASYTNDKKDGLQKNYYSTGLLNYVNSYVNDKQEGLSTSYYASGKKKNELSYKNDKAEGTYSSYAENGQLIMQGQYVNDLRQGLWVSNYDDGTIKDKTTYKDNEITGEFTEYFDNGTLNTKGNYTKKKIDGKIEYYDYDGKLFCDGVYEKGRLKEINFYDKAGNNISNTTTRKGAADITFFSPEGNKNSECYYDRDGNKDGTNTSYFASGKISAVTEYKQGEENGANTNYYPNGEKRLVNTYTKGDEDGYVKEYFENGALKSEGWKVKGDQQQQFIYYNVLGDVTSKEYYLNDELDGYTEYKYPNNISDLQYKYHNGWLQEVLQFDTTGKVISTNEFPQGKGPLVYYYYNGKKLVDGTYDHYMLSGVYTIYYPDGTPYSVSYYKNNKRDSVYKSYFMGGKPFAEGKYKDGNKDGVWKYYYDNGKLSEKEIYAKGSLNGMDSMYDSEGNLVKTIRFKDGNKDGEYKVYGDNNQLVIVINYKNGNVKSYSYEDKNGQLVAPILLKKYAGKAIAYYKNGTQSAEINFVDNDMQGVYKIFYSNGKVCVDSKKEYGLENGVKKVYYPNGNLKSEENNILGNLQGVRKLYYPNGNLKSEENFYNDDNHGTCKYYDEQGKLKQTRVYYYGNITSLK